MVDIYECKKMAKVLGDNCHNTKNRIIEKMGESNKKECKVLGDYLQCLMVLESLSSYICVCCCEHESLSSSIISELKNKCKDLVKKCKTVKTPSYFGISDTPSKILTIQFDWIGNFQNYFLSAVARCINIGNIVTGNSQCPLTCSYPRPADIKKCIQ